RGGHRGGRGRAGARSDARRDLRLPRAADALGDPRGEARALRERRAQGLTTSPRRVHLRAAFRLKAGGEGEVASRPPSPKRGPGGGDLLLGDDPDLDLDRDVAGVLDVDRVLAERLDGLVEVDLLAVHLVTLGGERLLDVARGDRAEELVALADLTRDLDGHVLHGAGQRLGVLALLGRAGLDGA